MFAIVAPAWRPGVGVSDSAKLCRLIRLCGSPMGKLQIEQQCIESEAPHSLATEPKRTLARSHIVRHALSASHEESRHAGIG
jgi:hypothetical protein